MHLIKSPTLECKSIFKAYKAGTLAVPVLENFSLTLTSGEIGMLMGPSGCGKTTLLMVAGGVLDPDQGTCRICEQDVYAMEANAKIAYRATHISFMFQHLYLLPALTALENVALPLLIDGVTKEHAHQEARVLMMRLGLEQHLESKLDVLSGGQKQRIAVGRALIRAPRLILCDEPTSNLDKESTEIVFSLIKDYANHQGCTFLISTHDYRITTYADKIFEFKGLNNYQIKSQREFYETEDSRS